MARRRCPVCGSKQWHKEPASGLIACGEGHILENYRNEVTDIDEVSRHALRKRAHKSSRTKAEPQNKTNPKLYHGTRSRILYFQCLQYMLRKQIAALVKLWQLPPEFEIVCRDVWALNLEFLPEPPPYDGDDGIEDANSNDIVDEGSRGRGKGSAAAKFRPGTQSRQNSSDSASSDGSNDGSSEEEEDVDAPGDEEDQELAALLRENSETSASEAEEMEPYGEMGPRQNGTKKRQKRLTVHERPASTVAVLVVGCWVMRIPILYRDLIRLVEAYDLPYLDPVARRLFPGNMIERLTRRNIQALSPHHAPTTLLLHGLASRLSKLMRSESDVFVPEANAGPMLWKIISQGLAGSPTLYMLTKRLAKALGLPLTLHYSLAPGLDRRRAFDPSSHNYDNAPPEVGLISAGMMVLKMVYGFDGRLRQPRDPDDPARTLPQIDEYLGLLRQIDEEESHKKMAMFDSHSRMNAGDLSDGMMDEYIRFCERVLLAEDESGTDGVLRNYFPLQGRTTSCDDEMDEDKLLKLQGMQICEEDEAGKPGEMYRVYIRQDLMGAVNDEYDALIVRAASWTGVPRNYLEGVVESFERRLAKSRITENGKCLT